MILSPFLFSCSGVDVSDSKKVVELTIYPDTGFNEYLFSDDMYGEFLQFSEGKSTQVQLLQNPGDSFADFKFQKGYKYCIKATKILLKHSPQGTSNVIYQYIETLDKKKVVTQDLESEIIMEVAPVKISYMPRGQEPQQAFLVKIITESKPRPILKIEGFDFEKGYTYRLKVKKSIQATPYKEKYTLIEVLAKNN